MAIKLGVHVRCDDGVKGYISGIEGDVITVTVEGGTRECGAESLKTLKGRPRKIVVAAPVEAPVAEMSESASV